MSCSRERPVLARRYCGGLYGERCLTDSGGVAVAGATGSDISAIVSCEWQMADCDDGIQVSAAG